jgi:signal transduction histidine kinase
LSRGAARVGPWGLICAGVAAAVWTAWFVSRSRVQLDPVVDATVGAAYIASLVAAGAYTWYRRPNSRLGLLVGADGLAWALTTPSASGSALPHTIGMTIWAGWIVLTLYMYLAFPRGRLDSRLERGVILAFAGTSVVIWALILVLAKKLPAGGDFVNCGVRCPQNALRFVNASHGVGDALTVAYASVTAMLTLSTAILVISKTRSQSALGRRATEPLSYVLVANLVLFVLILLVRPSYPGTAHTFKGINAALSLAIPLALIAGQMRGRLFAAESAGRLAASSRGRRVTPEEVQGLLRETLGDPTLILALADAETGGYVDVDGRPFALPLEQDRHERVRILTGGATAALVVHDPQIDIDAGIVQGLAASALMLLENAQLLEQLQESRQRLMTVADEERRRLERDLHDGAQHRLLVIQLKLGLLRERIQEEELARQLDELREQATNAADEIRALAHGIYPGLLGDIGLAHAVTEATRLSPIPVEVDDHGIGRTDPATDAALYFCILEAVQNAAKHAGRNAHVTVTLARSAGSVSFRVADDGAGFRPGASGSPGTGLTNMRDRIEALGGALEIESRPNRGTTIEAVVPIREGEVPGPR